MADWHGIAYWPGLETGGVISCNYTCVDGITPGVASVIIPWQDISKLQRFGSLTMTDSINPPLVLKDCLLDRVDGNPERTQLVLTILDRRWKWSRNGVIDGWYNQIDPYPTPDKFRGEGDTPLSFEDSVGVFREPGPFIPGTKRSLSTLWFLCFEAMGEPYGDEFIIGSDPPEDAFPPINWQKENPAAALQRLLDLVSWRLSYQPFPHNRVILHPLAGKIILPTGIITNTSSSINPADKPKAARVYGGPVWLSDRIKLEAVGMEANGEIVPIDELTYTPIKGWDHGPASWWEGNVEIGACESTKQAAEFANRYVYKMFRIVCDDENIIDGREILINGISKSGGSPASEFSFAEKLRNIRDRRRIVLGPAIMTGDRDATGQPITIPAYISGEFYDDTKSYWKMINSEHARWNRTEDISIDVSRGLVLSARPLYRKDGIGSPRRRARISITTSFQVRANNTNSIVVYELGKIWDEPDASERIPEDVIVKPEIVIMSHVIRVAEPSNEIRGGGANFAECVERAEYELNNRRLAYSDELSISNTYFGLLEINPGVGIRQVSYGINNGPSGSPATQIGVNTEHTTWLPPFQERRRFALIDWARIGAD